ncbi:FYVE zinc finger domain-containing protein [Desulfosudis oleivorans]|uniref:Uncharacterized protein n=1 Tax=Desulfosudis oleivorans (strain DSM 6200 / JCM 39069 / Hxd3) TaxID=96561 RepID=A8ZUN4_DESOH|nr:hypothetical protein [Desulfosudis oleivorans]ABW66447.1 hypothetical protein Dole_0637 [Desulfosudis oleivorans Hxd3]
MDKLNKPLRLVKVGQWLEDFLDPDAKPFRFKKLAQQAIRDYNLKFKLSDDDITIQYFKETLGKGNSDNESIIKKIINNYSQLDTSSIDNAFGLWSKIAVKRCSEGPLSVRGTIGNILAYLEKLNKANISWNHPDAEGPLPFLCFFDPSQPPGREAGVIIPEIPHAIYKVNRGLNILLPQEGLFSKALELNNEGLLLRHTVINPDTKETKIESDLDFLYPRGLSPNSVFRFGEVTRNNALMGDIEERFPSIFPWGPVAARYFIDFLLKGGQSRFLPCEHCGRFTFIKRKGKRFCSDSCRVRSSKQNL